MNLSMKYVQLSRLGRADSGDIEGALYWNSFKYTTSHTRLVFNLSISPTHTHTLSHSLSRSVVRAPSFLSLSLCSFPPARTSVHPTRGRAVEHAHVCVSSDTLSRYKTAPYTTVSGGDKAWDGIGMCVSFQTHTHIATCHGATMQMVGKAQRCSAVCCSAVCCSAVCCSLL